MGNQHNTSNISTNCTSPSTTSSKGTPPSSASGPLNLSCKPPMHHPPQPSHRKEDNNNQLDKLDIEMFNFASKSQNCGSSLASFPRNSLFPGAYERPSSPKSSSGSNYQEESASLAALEMLRKTKSMLFPSPPASMLAPSGGSAASSPSPHHHPHSSYRAGQNNSQHLPDVVSTLPIFSPNHPHFKSSPTGESLLMAQKHPHLHPSLFGTPSNSEQLRFPSLDYSPFRGFPGALPPHAPPSFPGFGSHLAVAAAAAAAAAAASTGSPGIGRNHVGNSAPGSNLPSTHHSNSNRGNLDGKTESQNDATTCQSKSYIIAIFGENRKHVL